MKIFFSSLTRVTQPTLQGKKGGSAHTVKAPALPIPLGKEGLVYSLDGSGDQ